MSSWIAVSRGALDVRALGAYDEGVEFIATPVLPGAPLALFGEGAQLWRRLVDDGPINASSLNENERGIVLEMEELGLASRDLAHPARQFALSEPWLISPSHELVYALVSSVARDRGIDAVFIKGPILHRQGIRDRAHSGDVDVWVEPGQALDLIDALRPWGWRLKAEVWGNDIINHSATADPVNGWGCQIDVHRRFPGLSHDDHASFIALHDFTEEMLFAGVSTRVSRGDASAVIAALHALRPEIGGGVSPQALEDARHYLRRGGGGVVPTAEALGAASVLAPLLRDVAPDIPLDGSIVALPPRDWVWRGAPSKAAAYAARIRELPWRLRFVFLTRIVWPSRAAVMESDHLALAGSRSVAVARWRRVRRGVAGYFRSWRLPSGPHESEKSREHPLASIWPRRG